MLRRVSLIISHLESAISGGMNSVDRPLEIQPAQIAELARIDAMVVPGRACGTCSLCCKVLSVFELAKPAGKWCTHCRPGNGCDVYATRPFCVQALGRGRVRYLVCDSSVQTLRCLRGVCATSPAVHEHIGGPDDNGDPAGKRDEPDRGRHSVMLRLRGLGT